MPRNIEIKARARDFPTQSKTAHTLAERPPRRMHQVDTFFHALSGRLKLREYDDNTAVLIQYFREDIAGPKQSTFICSEVPEPASLKAALNNALGIQAIVHKDRTLLLTGQTKIHLDEVANLGQFLELEVVLAPDQQTSEGVAIAERLMEALGIEESDLITGAYVDLLTAKADPS